MKKIYVLLFTIVLFFGAKAQVSLTASAGTATGTFTTLKGAFDAINAGTHQGSIIISINGNTSETAPCVLNSTGAGSAIYTDVLIKPTVAATISGATTAGRGLIELNGADNVTIDGAIASGGTARDLTITNTAANTIAYAMAVRIAVATTIVTSANGNVIKNLVVNGNATGRNISTATSTTGSENVSYGIYAGGGASTVAATTAPSAITSSTTVAGSGSTMNGLTISNNSVIACGRGIAVQASSTTVINTLTITNNSIGAATANASTTVYSMGMTAQGFAAANISGNTIRNIESFLATSVRAMDIGGISSASSTGAIIENNTISNVVSRSISGYGAYGMNLLLSSPSNSTIRNNFIYGLTKDMTGSLGFGTTFNINGIRIGGGTTMNIFHNTVNLSGALFGTATAQLTSCLTITGAGLTGIDVRNNIFSNTLTGGAANSANVCMYLPSAATSTFNLTLNNNAYYTGSTAGAYGICHAGTTYTNPNTAGVGLYTVAAFDATQITPTANFRSYSSTLSAAGTNDNASYASTSEAPLVSSTDLHLDLASAQLVNVEQKGDATVGVATDIDGETRPNAGTTLPDMGADEVAVASCSGQPNAGVISPATANRCVGQTYTIAVTGISTGTGISYQWQQSSTSGGPYANVTGGSGATTTSYTTPTLTAGVVYYILQTTCASSGLTNVSNELALTVNTLPTVSVSPTSASYCSPGGTPVALSASGASTYTWSPTAGLTPTTGANVSALPTATTTYTVTGTDVNGCINTATTTITVNAAPVITSVTATPTTVCSGASTQLQVNVASPVVKITEVTLNRTGTGATAPYPAYITGADLVELSNLSATSVDISGFTLSDYGNNSSTISHPFTFPTGTIIPSNGVAVVNLGTGTDDIANRYFNTGGANDSYLSGATVGIVLKAGGQVFDAVGLNTGYVFNAGTGVTAADWSGIASSPSGIAGTIRTASVDGNTGADWTASSAGTPQTIGTYNAGYSTVSPTSFTYSWTPTTGLSDPTIANPVASNITTNTTYNVSVSNGTCTSTGSVAVTLATYNTSVITQPSTTAVTAGSINNQVILMTLPQACNAETLTQFDFTNESTSAADASAAKVYYNTTNNFATATLFGTTNMPAATFTVTGSQALSTTTSNFFWLVFDVACNAGNTNVIDAGLTSFTVGASNFSPTPSNPTGTRTITGLASLFTTTQPSTAAVTAGGVNQQIVRISIPATTCGSLTDITFNTNGSTNAATDIAAARVFYTTSTTFNTTTQFGADASLPNGSFSVSGSQALSTTLPNYFWLVYDVSCGATHANLLDAEINNVTIEGNVYAPATINPTGTRTITGLQNGVVTVQPSTAVVAQGSINQQVIRVLIPATSCGPLTELVFNTNGSTNAATDLSKARVYYTTSTTFTTTTEFGTEINAPAGVLTFTGSQALSTTLSNYFWLVYDINCSATPANLVDAEINSIVTGGATLTPATPNPTGTRSISALYAPTRTDGNGTTAVQLGTQNAQFAYALISGSASCPGTVTDVNFTVTNPNPTDVVSAKAFYTTTSTFSNAVQFGTSIANPASGALTFTGSQLLATGNNYFWVVYDISCTGTVGASLNADINSLVVSGNTISVTGTATAANTLAAITSFTTVADGEWNSASTWACGNVPATNATTVIITHNITVSNTGNIGGSVTINSGRSLTINPGGELILGTVGGGNRTLTNSGILSVTGGVLTVNGNVTIASGSTFNQSGGEIIIDPNSGVVGSSVGSGTTTFLINSSFGSVTGGSIKIVDPNFNSSGKAFDYNVGSTPASWGLGHTLIIGDAASVDPSLNTAGFILEQYTSTGKLAIGNLVIDGGSGTNKQASLGSWSTFVNGSLTVNANSFFTIAAGSTGAVISGNITNNGTITQSSTSGLILAATSGNSTVVNPNPQTIGGSGIFRNLLNSPTAELTNLTVNNSSVAGVTLATSLRISGTLNMTAGRINTDATNLLTLGFSTTAVGTFTYTVGHIVGPFKRWISAATGARQFPMGNGTDLKNASINYTLVPTTAGSLTARWSTTAPNFPNASPLVEGALVVNKASSQGSWFIEAADGLAGGIYTGTFTANGSTDIIDFTKTVLIKRPAAGGDWTLDGTHVTSTGSNTAPVLSRTGMTDFSEFAIGGENSVVLPVILDFFRGSKQATSNVLDWKVTCISSPSVMLSIERSADNRNFKSIYNLSVSSVRCESPFNFNDFNPPAGVNFYRLKMVDIDGRITYSQIVALVNAVKGLDIVSVYPNPVHDIATVDIASAKRENVVIRVVDLAGKVVLTSKQNLNSGTTKVQLVMNNLSAGTYIVTLVAEGQEIKSTKLIKN